MANHCCVWFVIILVRKLYNTTDAGRSKILYGDVVCVLSCTFMATNQFSHHGPWLFIADWSTGNAFSFQFESHRFLPWRARLYLARSAKPWGGQQPGYLAKGLKSVDNCSCNSWLVSKTRPCTSSCTNSGRQRNCLAQTGTSQPKRSRTFMGRSIPDVEVCNEIPTSAQASRRG